MKNGDTEEGAHVLRAKIDMAAQNMLMRDPIMYRSLHKNIIGQVMTGIFIQCMTGLMEKAILWKNFPFFLYAGISPTPGTL